MNDGIIVKSYPLHSSQYRILKIGICAKTNPDRTLKIISEVTFPPRTPSLKSRPMIIHHDDISGRNQLQNLRNNDF